MKPSSMPLTHPLIKAGTELKCKIIGSAITSDKAILPFASLKIGPGEAERNHQPNEFVFLEEIRQAIEIYTRMLEKVLIVTQK
jgi:acetylornithine deacetylase